MPRLFRFHGPFARRAADVAIAVAWTFSPCRFCNVRACLAVAGQHGLEAHATGTGKNSYLHFSEALVRVAERLQPECRPDDESALANRRENDSGVWISQLVLCIQTPSQRVRIHSHKATISESSHSPLSGQPPHATASSSNSDIPITIRLRPLHHSAFHFRQSPSGDSVVRMPGNAEIASASCEG